MPAVGLSLLLDRVNARRGACPAMKKVFKFIFDGILTPAVAGNILWSFFNILLTVGSPTINDLPHLLMLFILSFYLLIDLLQTKTRDSSKMPMLYWIFETLFLLALTATALSTQLNPAMLKTYLTIYFATVIIGHLFDAWALDNEIDRRKLVGANLIGLAVLWLGDSVGLAEGWEAPVSFLFALVLWISWARKFDLGRIEGSL